MERFLRLAYEQARISYQAGGIPVGSVLVHGDQVVGRGHNQRMQQRSVTLHGEMDALENAGRRSADFYQGCTLYTTLSPCSMCSGAIVLYGIPRVIVGENRSFLGEELWLKSRGVIVEVHDDPECFALMQKFIAEHPDVWNEDIGV